MTMPRLQPSAEDLPSDAGITLTADAPSRARAPSWLRISTDGRRLPQPTATPAQEWVRGHSRSSSRDTDPGGRLRRRSSLSYRSRRQPLRRSTPRCERMPVGPCWRRSAAAVPDRLRLAISTSLRSAHLHCRSHLRGCGIRWDYGRAQSSATAWVRLPPPTSRACSTSSSQRACWF